MRLVPAILALTSTLAAGASDVARFAHRPGGAEVYYATTTTVVDVAGIEHDLDSGRLMLDFAEAANDWLYLGVAVGLAFDSMPSEPLIADTDPVGYALGAFAGARYLELGPFALTAEGTRKTVDRARLVDGLDPRAEDVLKRLTSSRLVTTKQSESGATGELERS